MFSVQPSVHAPDLFGDAPGSPQRRDEALSFFSLHILSHTSSFIFHLSSSLSFTRSLIEHSIFILPSFEPALVSSSIAHFVILQSLKDQKSPQRHCISPVPPSYPFNLSIKTKVQKHNWPFDQDACQLCNHHNSFYGCLGLPPAPRLPP